MQQPYSRASKSVLWSSWLSYTPHHHTSPSYSQPTCIYIKPDSSAVLIFFSSFPYRFSFFYPLLKMTATEQADPVFQVPKRLLNGDLPKPHIVGFDEYKKLWEQSVNDPDTFFGNVTIVMKKKKVAYNKDDSWTTLHASFIVGTRYLGLVQAFQHCTHRWICRG